MYTKYFGLNKPPFKITPDPEFFFPGGNRGAVLEALLYAVSRGEGIVKVVGEVGSGKTMLCRMLERELPDDCEIVYIANPRLSPEEILHAIAIELALNVAKDASKVEVMRILHAYLLEKHANGRRVVMFIEEAQGMEIETLEEIRMLSNLETTQDKLLQIVLFGQPELDEKLHAHEIRQLQERITYAFELKPLDRGEIRDYLNTRIRASGFRGNDLFSNGSIRTLERLSAGLLRRINILADKALLAAFARGDRAVRPMHFRMAARDSEFNRGASRFQSWMPGAAVAVASVVAVTVWWAAQQDLREPRQTLGTTAAERQAPPATAKVALRSSQIARDSEVFEDVRAKSRHDGDITVPQGELVARPDMNPLAVVRLIDLGIPHPADAPASGAESLAEFMD